MTDDETRKLIHDLRNDLFALTMRVQLLELAVLPAEEPAPATVMPSASISGDLGGFSTVMPE